MFYTGKQRLNKNILGEQNKSTQKNEKQVLDSLEDWNSDTLQETMKSFMEENDFGFGKVMKPVRLALCGTINGPSLFSIMELIGKDASIRRIKHALDHL